MKPNTLSAEGLELATRKRNKLYDFFDENGIKYASGNLSKPYLGDLSPGCWTCVHGTWACIYINGLCTHHCFYCPRDRSITEERLPRINEFIEFTSATDCILYLKKFHFEGIGFSGGEPFLAFDRLLEYIEEIRRVFGSQHYIWVYTNGDLVTKEQLGRLKDAGINEIRFDIAASQYRLKPVELAAKMIDTVSIEIPAIPEDVGIMKSNLKYFEDLGVKYLNLHQLMLTQYNEKAFTKRNYSLTNVDRYDEFFPVPESEISALEILRYAVENKSNLGINCCTRCYKARFQGMAERKRYSSFFKDKSITETGYMREFSIKGSKEEVHQIQGIFKQDKLEHEVQKNENGLEINFPPECLSRLLDQVDYKIIHITYYEPCLRQKNNSEVPAATFGCTKIFLESKIALKFELKNKTSAIFFQKLFLENKNSGQASDEIIELFGLEKRHKQDVLEDCIYFYQQLEDVEYISGGLLGYK